MRLALNSVLIVALVAWIAPNAMADMSLVDIQQRLLKTDILRFEFQQEKILRALRRPLLSKGTVLVIPDEGILWSIKEPYKFTILMRSDQLVEWDGEGEIIRTSTAKNPITHSMSKFTQSMFSANLTPLQQYYLLSPGTTDNGWKLLLTPKSKQLGEVVVSILIAGDRFINEVKITEVKGDSTNLTFSNFSTSPLELNEFEKQIFNY